MVWISIIIAVFIIGYLCIVFEHPLKINKAASALLIGAMTWGFLAISDLNPLDYLVGDGAWQDYLRELSLTEPTSKLKEASLLHHLADIASILFFLMGAMAIVELIDLHDGFHIITSKIKTTDKRVLLWLVCGITFFLSAILDNLTTSIVMASLLRKLIEGKYARMIYAGMVIIAANAGGAFSPIGDITTTMLWIGGQITSMNIITGLFIPSVVAILVPLLLITFRLRGNFSKPLEKTEFITTKTERTAVLVAGVSALIFVPIFKTVTHLPPFMGMFFGLGVMWIITEILHKSKDIEEKSKYSAIKALSKIDTSSVLFFFGILAGIACLETIGQLHNLAELLNTHIGNEDLIAITIGLLSAIVDNVPLVAASMGMYDIAATGTMATDGKFWELIAFCAGTGGSTLIIGSAAGVAVMGIEKIDFIWYLKKIGGLALAGYLSGVAVFLAGYYWF
ncbi:MAG: Na+/H+ antiporter NhaD/arsenite permease-like protein [Sphingobacteriales bacterium]|jgi:Na+/H+ antiporter NhaD/arsenite permease-like protein